MGFWKVAGGIGAGIGAVVLLPVAGPVLAVTAVGAAVAGTVGGAAGVAASVADKKKREIEEAEARAKAAAKQQELKEAKKKNEQAQQKLAKLEQEKQGREAIEKAKEAARKTEEAMREAAEKDKRAMEELAAISFDFISKTENPLTTFITCCKLQISMANSDGIISDDEIKDIETFLSGLGTYEAANDLREQVREILENPPIVEDVLKEIIASEPSQDVLQGYLDVLVAAMLADGVIHRNELDFIDRFVEKFDSVERPLNLPYRCLQLPMKIEEDIAVVALCVEPTEGHCEIWINDECHTSDKPLPALTLHTFKSHFDSDALSELDDLGVCNAANHVCFVICAEEVVYKHAEKVIQAGGDRYSITRCPCGTKSA